ncbi:MAG TPA: hypothetical protein VGY77_11585 [Gemmataceae bacterium]|nr:hypothetical protein [Gemmataceae bacterium]
MRAKMFSSMTVLLLPSILFLSEVLGGPCQLRGEEKRIADRELVAWVDKRIQDWQPTNAERRFDEIGWVKGIREALRLGKEHNRPVFLFTHDGRMAIGRC